MARIEIAIPSLSSEGEHPEGTGAIRGLFDSSSVTAQVVVVVKTRVAVEIKRSLSPLLVQSKLLQMWRTRE